MIEPSEQIKARIDAEYADKGRSIVAREREHDRGLDGIAWEMGDWACERPPAYGDMTRLAGRDRCAVGYAEEPRLGCAADRTGPPPGRSELVASCGSGWPGAGGCDAVLAEAALYSGRWTGCAM